MSSLDFSTPNLARKSVRQRVSNRETRLPFKFSVFFMEKTTTKNFMLAFRVVCCSHHIDRRIRICILRQSDHCTRVCIVHQSNCRIRVRINQSYHQSHDHYAIFHVRKLYSTNQISFCHISLRSIACHFLVHNLRFITYSNRNVQPY